jgi:hypothetical protein
MSASSIMEVVPKSRIPYPVGMYSARGTFLCFNQLFKEPSYFLLTCRCLESIGTGVCPLCRDRFHPRDTRRLHIDIDAQGTPDSLKAAASVESSTEARKLQDSIARIVKDGSSENHLRALIEECSTFLKTQNRGHVSVLPTAICLRRLIRHLHSTRICGSAFA